MKEYNRSPIDVIGNDPDMLCFWDSVPDEIRSYLLASPLTIPTLGELQLMCHQLGYLTDEPPAVF